MNTIRHAWAIAPMFLCAVMAFFSLPIMAANAATIDFTPMLSPVLELVGVGVALGLVWLVRRAISAFEDRTNMQLDDQLKNRLDQAIWNGVSFGKQKVAAHLNGRLSVSTQNQIASQAATYVLKAVPEAISYFDLTQDRVIELVEARLQQDLNGDGFIGKPFPQATSPSAEIST